MRHLLVEHLQSGARVAVPTRAAAAAWIGARLATARASDEVAGAERGAG